MSSAMAWYTRRPSLRLPTAHPQAIAELLAALGDRHTLDVISLAGAECSRRIKALAVVGDGDPQTRTALLEIATSIEQHGMVYVEVDS